MAISIEDALDIAGVRARQGKIMCPRGHDKDSPSLHIYFGTDSCTCFGCGFTADAYGLLAALTGRNVGDVLRQYGDGRVEYTDATADLSPYKLRTEAHWLPIMASNPLFVAIKGAKLSRWKRELLLAEASDWYEDKRAEVEDLPPFEIERAVRKWKADIARWLEIRGLNGS